MAIVTLGFYLGKTVRGLAGLDEQGPGEGGSHAPRHSWRRHRPLTGVAGGCILLPTRGE